MKAIQINQYGTNDVLEINDIPSPVPKNGQVLVETYAASINPFDLKIRAGYLAKMAPLQFPATLGGDFAGVIKALGADVTEYKVGDEVYGSAIVLSGGSGSFAEELAANTKNISLKPKTASFEEAAALPLVGSSAIQALEEHMKLQKGQKILIHGGAGGIGHIAIQLAKTIGAYVATTVSTDDVDFVKTLGADEIIDYKNQNFEAVLEDYDAVYDTVGGETTKSFAVLKNRGILVSMLGQLDPKIAKTKGITAINQNTSTNTQHLKRLAELVDSGGIKVSIEKIYSLSQIKEAANHQELHPRGKLVVRIR
jgi:NADPH:quinone reductase-like Zn-dependent oxidoreductase